MKNQTLTKTMQLFTIPDTDMDALETVTDLIDTLSVIDDSLLDVIYEKFIAAYYATPYARKTQFIQDICPATWKTMFRNLSMILEILQTMFFDENQTAYENDIDNNEEE